MVEGPGETFRFVKCRACGLVRLSPRPSLETLATYYDHDYLPHRGPAAWGRHAPTVERAQEGTDRARAKAVEAAVKLTRTSRVLDLGCGKPTFLATVRDRTGARCTGVDFAAEAWSATPERWHDLDLRAGPLDMPGLEGPFDAITMWHALEHDLAPVETLRRLRSLAAPGAALVVEVPDLDSLTHRLHGARWGGFHTPRHTLAFTAATLQKTLEAGGWRVERMQKHGTMDPYVLWWLGAQERNGRGVRGSLEGRFVPFVLGKIAASPVTLLQRFVRLGVQLAVARA
jgi:SAM-dependent methyltransferase